MVIAGRIIALCWLCFGAVWLVSARFVKKAAITGGRWWVGALVRIAIFIVILLILRSPHFGPLLRHLVRKQVVLITASAVRSFGAVLCVAGLAFAVWARIHLGRNWGMPMSLRQEHELVTTGPYGWVRHPIYSGIIVALFGTELYLGSVLFIAVLVGFSAYSLFCATHEEELMARQFPHDYPAYRKKTKMLIPLVL